MKKQFIAKLLVLAMVLSMVPVTILAASAAGSGSGSGSGSGGYYTPVDNTVRVNEPISSDGVIEVKVVNGTATVALNAKAVESLADLAKGGEITLEIKAEGATKVDVSFPAKALTAFAEKTGANLTYELGEVATISIPNEALATVFGTSGNAKISAQASGSSIGFTIQVSGRSLKGIKGLQVTF